MAFNVKGLMEMGLRDCMLQAARDPQGGRCSPARHDPAPNSNDRELLPCSGTCMRCRLQ